MRSGNFLIDLAQERACPGCSARAGTKCDGPTCDERLALAVSDWSGASKPKPEPKPTSKPTGSKWDSINKAKARAKEKGGDGLNGAERRYRARLERKRIAGEVLFWSAQAVNLRLGHDAWYRPDFVVIDPDHVLVYVEVKGKRGWKLDPKGRVKWKVAATAHPYARFRGALWDGSKWEHEDAKSAGCWPPETGGAS